MRAREPKGTAQRRISPTFSGFASEPASTLSAARPWRVA